MHAYNGKGVGAIRHCEFTTGRFVEPITVWEPPYRLGFAVKSQPPVMNELSPYPNIEPLHLEGYFENHRGEFLLERLPNGHTRLIGTTWYENHMWPQAYWQLWSDLLIHRIHLRVLNHIKAESELAVAK